MMQGRPRTADPGLHLLPRDAKPETQKRLSQERGLVDPDGPAYLLLEGHLSACCTKDLQEKTPQRLTAVPESPRSRPA